VVNYFNDGTGRPIANPLFGTATDGLAGRVVELQGRHFVLNPEVAGQIANAPSIAWGEGRVLRKVDHSVAHGAVPRGSQSVPVSGR